MTVPSVTTNTPITTAWGNAVATDVNALSAGIHHRYTPLTTTFVLINNTSVTDEVIQETAEITAVPTGSVVKGVSGVLLIKNSDTANSQIAVHHHGGGECAEVYASGVADKYSAASFAFCQTGGLNQRKIKFSSDWISGTQTRIVKITGYWTQG